MKARIGFTGIRIGILLLMLSFIITANAQTNRRERFQEKRREHIKERVKEKGEKVEAQKVAFITRKLNLTPKEAQDFWPVYNEYSAKKRELFKNYLEKYGHQLHNPDSIKSGDLKELVDCQLIQEQKMLDLKKEYHAKFKSILPPEKVIILYSAERHFKTELVKNLRDRRQGKD